MKIIRLFFVFVFMLGAFNAQAVSAQGSSSSSAAQFFLSLTDIPLMPGLVEIPEYGVEFDKPEGRVVESVAEMHGVAQGEVKSFYKNSLPQFGWTIIDDQNFARQSEYLVFYFEHIDGHDFVRVMLMPR